MAQKLVQKRSRHSIAAKPVARISSGGKDTTGSSSGQSHARASNGSRDKHGGWHATFSNMACSAARYAGHPLAFLTAVLLVLIWALTGPLFAYSDTWQLVINTSTTIVTSEPATTAARRFPKKKTKRNTISAAPIPIAAMRSGVTRASFAPGAGCW